MSIIHQLAADAGFSACFVLPPDPFFHYERRLLGGACAVVDADAENPRTVEHFPGLNTLDSAGQNLVVDPRKAAPWGNALLFLIVGYRPYVRESGVSGNYPSSNTAFHAADDLIGKLNENGIRAERIYVPVRELALRTGIGIACKNGLTAYQGFGTRVAVQTLIVSAPEPVRYDAKTRYGEHRTCPEECRVCESVCPSHAIHDGGMHVLECARKWMQKDAMEDWVMDAMESILGCELCQFACPLNSEIPLDDDVPDAFDLERLLRNDVKPALEIVGKNINPGGRIVAHAIVLAAHGGRRDLIPLIEPYLADERPAVQSAARYAIKKLASAENTM